MDETKNTAAFPALAGAEFMLLTTFRRDGRGVATTVWFAQVGDRLYVTTMAGAGKAKRIRATGRVTVAPSTAQGQVLGASAGGQGHVLSPEEFATARAALRAKYVMFDEIAARSPGGGAPERIFMEILPEAGRSA